MPHVTVNSAALYWVSAGSGPLIVQVHGAGVGRANFAAVTPVLSRQFTVINYDQRGFGDSDAPVQPYSIESWADDLAGLLEALAIERVHIHATSMGGIIAMAFAAKYPEMVDHLILTATLAKYDSSDTLRRRVRGHLIGAYGKGEEALDFFCYTFFSRAYLDSDRSTEGRALLRQMIERQTSLEVDRLVSDAVAAADVRWALAKIKAPTLVIGAKHDIASAIDSGPTGAGSRAIAAGIPNAKMLEIESGHMVLIEQPQAVAAAIAEFLG